MKANRQHASVKVLRDLLLHLGRKNIFIIFFFLLADMCMSYIVFYKLCVQGMNMDRKNVVGICVILFV